jgi:hypothetical protein
LNKCTGISVCSKNAVLKCKNFIEKSEKKEKLNDIDTFINSEFGEVKTKTRKYCKRKK